MNKSKRPKITDVAQLVGVSRGVVSVVLNNRVGEQVRVSEETQAKIWAAAAELGYVANPVAQSLAGGRNRIIAVFTFEPIFPIDSSSFYYPFLIGIEEEAHAQGYDLLLVTGSNLADNGSRHIYQKGFNRLRRADGAILLGHGDQEEIRQLLEEGYPFVFVGRRESPSDEISYVSADYRAATVALVTHLVEQGHRQLVYLRSDRDTEASADRELGMSQAIEQHALPLAEPWLWSGAPSDLSTEVLAAYLAQGVTGFVVEDDQLGERLLALAKESGLSCPDDLSMVMLGDPLNPLIDVPNWTSFAIPRRQMGREALSMLLKMLDRANDESQPLRKQLACRIKLGESVRSL